MFKILIEYCRFGKHDWVNDVNHRFTPRVGRLVGLHNLLWKIVTLKFDGVNNQIVMILMIKKNDICTYKNRRKNSIKKVMLAIKVQKKVRHHKHTLTKKWMNEFTQRKWNATQIKNIS